MKKYFIICILFLFIALSAQEFEIETVKEIEAERELSEWIETMLFPIIGETIVITNLTLEYPASRLEVYGSTLDKRKSLPGLPIAKSKSVMSTMIDDQETYPTIIVKKEITIYMKKDIDESLENFIRQNVAFWMHINPEKGDRLEIKSIMEFHSGIASEKEEKKISGSVYLILGIILLLFFLLSLFILRSGMGKITSSLQNINVTGFEKALRVKGDLHSESATSAQSASSMMSSPDKPLQIRVVEDTKDDPMDISFLEELSLNNFYKLIKDEKPADIAFILSNLSVGFAQNFLNNYKGDSKNILKSMLSENIKPKKEIEKLKKNLLGKFAVILEDEKLSFNGKDRLIEVINTLPNESCKKILAQINTINTETGKKIREKVFLLTDIVKLQENEIENIMLNVPHDLIVSFLLSVESEIKYKLLNSVTTRIASILKEDMEFAGQLSEEEQEKVRFEMLLNIRKILNYTKG